MGWRFRKRLKILPGVHLNLSKNGVSTTIGGKGASINHGKNGTFLNLGIPGTGVYSRQRINYKKSNTYEESDSIEKLCEDSKKLLERVDNSLDCIKTTESKIEWYIGEKNRGNISESQLQEELFKLKNNPKYKEARISFGMDIDSNKSYEDVYDQNNNSWIWVIAGFIIILILSII